MILFNYTSWFPVSTDFPTSGASTVSSQWENYTQCICFCIALPPPHTHIHAGLNPTALREKARNCHERTWLKETNPSRMGEKARRTATHVPGRFKTYLEPWLLPKQRNRASDLDEG